MTDYFALLNEQRRPWLDPNSLKATFLALSATVHPDRYHEAPDSERALANQRYIELNAAYQCLRDPKQRLLHLLELESGAKPVDIEQLPDAILDLGFSVARLCREVDQFLSEYSKVTSPLVKAARFERAQELTGKLQAEHQHIAAHQSALERELQEMNAIWLADTDLGSAHGSARPWHRVEEIYRLFGYTGRWIGQLQERIVQLAL